MTLFNYDNLIKEFKRDYFKECKNSDENILPVEILYYVFRLMKIKFYTFLILIPIIVIIEFQIILELKGIYDNLLYMVPLATLPLFFIVFLWKFRNHSIYNLTRLDIRLEAIKKTYLANELLEEKEMFKMIESIERGEAAKDILAEAYFNEHQVNTSNKMSQEEKEAHMIAFHWLAWKTIKLPRAKNSYSYFFASLIKTGDDNIANYGTILNQIEKIEDNVQGAKQVEKVQSRLLKSSELLRNYSDEMKQLAKKSYNPN